MKKKARIRVKNACVLIGVIDDSGVLEDGEVYISVNRTSFEPTDPFFMSSISKFQNGKAIFGTTLGSEVVSGKVIVCKNPCTTPGDIRLLNAVTIEQKME